MKSKRAMRVASLLMIERACSILETEKTRLATSVLTQNQAREALRNIIDSFIRVRDELVDIKRYQEKTTKEIDKQKYKNDMITRLIRFFTNTRDLIANDTNYMVGTQKLLIYQNRDFIVKITSLLNELDKQWKLLTVDISNESEPRFLKSLSTEVRRNLRNSISSPRPIDKTTRFEDLEMETSKTPRQLGNVKTSHRRKQKW